MNTLDDVLRLGPAHDLDPSGDGDAADLEAGSRVVHDEGRARISLEIHDLPAAGAGRLQHGILVGGEAHRHRVDRPGPVEDREDADETRAQQLTDKRIPQNGVTRQTSAWSGIAHPPTIRAARGRSVKLHQVND